MMLEVLPIISCKREICGAVKGRFTLQLWSIALPYHGIMQPSVDRYRINIYHFEEVLVAMVLKIEGQNFTGE